MKRFLIIFSAIFVLWNTNVFAYEGRVVSIGDGLDNESKSSMLSIIKATEDTPEVVVSNKDEKDYLSGILPESRMSSKAVICASIASNGNGNGIIADTTNTEYITPEMLVNSLITAGIKDIDVSIAAPYSVSGNTCIIYVIKAYEKMTGSNVSERATSASAQELAVMSDLGQKIGMKKALQFVNGIKVEVINNPIQNRRTLNEIISSYESKFDLKIDENTKTSLMKLMDRISNLGLNEEDVLKQQKNISSYINDESKTAVDDNIFIRFLNWLLAAFKNISKLFG